MKEIKPLKLERFTIVLAPITKKNSQEIHLNKYTGKRWISPSPKYKEYEHAAAWFMPHIKTIKEPVNVQAVFYMPTRRRVDLVNLQEALLDVMVRYCVIADDNSEIVCSMDGSRVEYDKQNPRTEVTITYLEEQEEPE